MIGGLGDDHYHLWAANSVVTERAGEGIDTVYARYWGSATLAANVENLFLMTAGSTSGTGNAIDNVIVAGTVGATLNGKGGDDVLVGGAGADVFVIEKGNGSDAIMNFQPGNDAILLQGYGFSTFAQLKSAATQVGGDVSINLGGGEVLVMRSTALSNLQAADFGMRDTGHSLAATFSSAVTNVANLAASAPITLVGAGKGWNANGWYVVNNMWGVDTLKEGTDFVVNSTFTRSDMTSGVTFNWAVPYTTDVDRTIRGYPEVAFGVSPKGNYAGNPTDTAVVFPVKVGDLTSLTADYSVSYTGTKSGFNVAYDIWLTSEPNGDASTITNEIMVWVHKGAFEPFGEAIGTYTQDGFSGTIYHEGTYTAIVSDTDVPAGKLDVTAILAKLETLGIVSDSEYLASIELGAEVVSGIGSLTINNLDLTVVSQGANGSLITKVVGGDGTVVTETAPVVSLPESTPVSSSTSQLLDDTGLVVGSRTTSVAGDGTITVRNLDKGSNLIGTDVIHKADAAGRALTEHFNAAAKLTGYDVIVKQSDGSVVTERYDASWKMLGVESVRLNSDGTTSTHHFDGQNKLTAIDIATPGKDGSVATYHYDANWAMQAIDVTYQQGAKTTVYHYDGKWQLGSIDMTIVDAKGVSVQHFDKNWKLTGAENVVVATDGSQTTTHYGANWALAGYETDKIDASGITVSTNYNAKWQVTSIDYIGTGAAETISGGASVSNLYGGLGSDVLKGGTGAANFYFDTKIGSDVDTILNFAAAKDTIMLDNDIFTAFGTVGALSSSAFVVGTAATSAASRILYDKASGDIFYDADGTGSAAAVLFAHLQPNTALTAADFQIIA